MSDKAIIKQKMKDIAKDRIAESNIAVAKTLIVISAICFLFWLCFQLDLLKAPGVFVNISLLAMPFLFLSTSWLCIRRKGKGAMFPYFFFFSLALFWFELDLMSGYKSRVLLPILIVLSLRYYSKQFTIFTYFVCIFVLLCSVFANAYLYNVTGFLDLNTVFFDTTYHTGLQGFIYNNIIALSPKSTLLIKNGLILVMLPNIVFLTGITVIATRFMKYNLLNIIKLEELVTKEANGRAELMDIKTKVVLSQVKPHFIYNVLSSIAVLCKKDPKKAKELTLNFSDYLRSNLDTIDGNSINICPFLTELSHIKNYLEIEKVRFEDRLNVEYEILADEFTLPTLSIQPIVENAVKHGICSRIEGGNIKIKSEAVENGWLITVCDDGVGFDKDAILKNKKVHVGLLNIEKRINLFGGTFGIESEVGKGTTAKVFIPNDEV